MNPGENEEHLRRLGTAGIDTAAAQRRGQFELRTNTETYLRDGRFDRTGCWRPSSSWPTAPRDGGFSLSRIVCQMDWAAGARSHVDDLVEFESRVNTVWERHEDAVICATTWPSSGATR